MKINKKFKLTTKYEIIDDVLLEHAKNNTFSIHFANNPHHEGWEGTWKPSKDNIELVEVEISKDSTKLDLTK